MSVTCASMRRVHSGTPRPRVRTRRTRVAANTMNDLNTSTPKYKKRQLEEDDDFDKENAFRSPNMTHKMLSMTSTPLSCSGKSTSRVGAWNVKDVLTPIKQQAVDRSSVHLQSSPMTVSTPRHNRTKPRRADTEYKTPKCRSMRANKISQHMDRDDIRNVLLNPWTLNDDSVLDDSSNLACSSPLRGCDLSPCQRDPASPEQSEPSDTMSELYTSKALNNLSVISQQPGSGMHEQASSANLSGAFHSTFNYPLHSTLNYPLYSTFNLSDDFVPKFAEKVTLTTPAKTTAASKQVTSCDGTFLEESHEHESVNSSTFCDSSCLSDDESSIDVDEYAARYDSMTMKRQTGKSELSGNRTVLMSTNDKSDVTMHDVINEGSTHELSVGDISSEYQKTELTRSTCYSALPNVWYSPNNTLRCDRKLLSELPTPSHQHHIAKRRRVDCLSQNIPDDSLSPSHTTTKKIISTSLTTPTRRNRSMRHYSACERLNATMYNIRPRSRHVTITDNTGRDRTITLRRCDNTESSGTQTLSESSTKALCPTKRTTRMSGLNNSITKSSLHIMLWMVHS